MQPDTPPQDGFDRLLAYFRGMEIRGAYAGQEVLTLQATYLAWASSGDQDERMRAIEDSPVELLPPEIIRQGQALRAARLSPEHARKIEDLRTLQHSLQSALDIARKELFDGLPKEPGLAEVVQTGDPSVLQAS